MPRKNRRKDTPPNPGKLEALLVQLRKEWKDLLRAKRSVSR